MLTCPSCGQENPEGFRFCGACASPLTQEAPARREERKVVTVLFADLVGFTGRAERMDPEDVRALLGPYHARLRDELERHGGTVEKFIGDAVMALFGAPVAHEDDPERAVRAALAIRDWIAEQGQDLQIRIAVNTGEALVALGARPSEGEAMAAGDVVNTAARMQAAAPVNGILVNEIAFHATRQTIDYAETEPVSAKGKAEPIRVWEALQARSRVGVDVANATRASLVGRERELDALRDALVRARSEKSVQLVTLVGVPGIGKSRLVYELMQVVDQEPELVTWRQGRSLPYGEGVSFWALSEIVKAQAGILESDRPEEARATLRRAVETLVAEPAEANWMTDWLGTLVGLGGQEEVLAGNRRGDGFAAWRAFLEALAEARPLVLVFEDLHWADEALLDFIDELVEWTSGVPLLALCTTRPELLERRPGWGGGKANALTISLPPLDDDQTARLIAALLDRPVVAAETQQALLARAGGNPLYTEQYARMLAERGELEGLPETVHGIIAARLDALSTAEKMLLQDAAVVGTVFWRGAVEAIDGVRNERADALLHALERKEFVQRVRRSSVANESQYAFRHVLIRDVAYRQIPRAARAEKHRRAAEWIQSLGRPEDHAELIAHHYLTALELAQAAGEEAAALSQSARHALRDAGDRAASLGAHAASARFYAAALDLWPDDDPERAGLLVSAGRALFWHDETGIELLEQGFEALRSAGDADRAAEAAVQLARCFWLRGDRDAAYAYVDQALQLAGPNSGSRARAYALVARSGHHMLASEFPDALRLAQEAFPLVEALGIAALRARTRDVTGLSRAYSGDADGIDDLAEAVAVARAGGAFYELHTAYNNLRASQLYLGRVEDASRLLDEFRRSAERSGTADIRRWVRTLEAGDLHVKGRADEALALVDEEIDQAEQGSPHYQEPAWRTLRASIRLARGDRAGAGDDSARATELARRTKDPQSLAPTLAMRARILMLEGRRDEAASLVSEVLALGRRLLPGLMDDAFTGESLVAFAWVACDLGRNDELVAAIEVAPRTPWADAAIAIARADPMGAAEILGRLSCSAGEAYTRLRAAEVFLRDGCRDEAEAELAKALAFYRETHATAYVREAEALLTTIADRAEHGQLKRRTSTKP